MKRIYKFLIYGAILLTPLAGCDNDALTDLNISPTQANEVDWRFLFTTGLVQTAENRYTNGRVNLGLCSALIQHMATLESGGERACGDKYCRALDAFNAFQWYVTRDALKTVAEVVRQTGPDGANPGWTNLHHMAQVVYIISMHIMTDLYGNVPYTEANKGIEGIFFPKYDSQESIYKDMLAKLEAAANAIGAGPDNVGAADLMYGGDFDKWKKFTNSMMLRLAMRLSKVDPATAQEYVQKAISGGVMTSNDDMAYLQMASGPSQWFNQNGISRAMIPDDWGAQHMMSKTLIDWLKAHDDPRLMIYSSGIGPWDGEKITDPAAQMGMPNGYDSETIKEFLGTTNSVDRNVTFSRMNEKLLDVDDPFIFMTYAEVEFLLAEAAVKGWGANNAEDHYHKGVRAAMQQWTIFDESLTVSDAEVDAYLAANPFDGTEEMIGEQHWAANFMQWFEAYSNYRRTGYPVLQEHSYPGNISGGTIFKRIEYYTAEVAVNPNVQTGGTMPDEVTTPVWWDVN